MKKLTSAALLALLVAAPIASFAQTAGGDACPPGKHRRPAGEDTRSTTSTDNGGQANTRRQPAGEDTRTTASTDNGGQANTHRQLTDEDTRSTTSTAHGGQAITDPTCQ